MNDNPYEKLQVPEDASFEQIQEARDLLLQTHYGDDRLRTEIEAAYDAILMERLRLRQEGKIKVPERIRYAERLAEQAPQKNARTPAHPAVTWGRQQLDLPKMRGLLITTGVFAGLAILGIYAGSTDSLALVLSLGVTFNIVWISRKEQRLGRAFLLTLIALVVGAGMAALLLNLGVLPLALGTEEAVSLAVFVTFWLVSNFLR
ncbi:CPP1-like family protein [Candidatus Synechococcus calcipolaris G9]|uniref:CPP1-like family protein n=1 Tax=Candidatus Synechococcus calcipolaris G9 TaxID=1497997 RepID=A0ABT6F1D6_9SYNE|nr:CPP1-like family protein [Candidatus Synechococcus calcipolaris]MDG2991649.1 CPP1-like family protein [Candidatus Synechococcus calcipolaris G9]